jgi:hypothetical protein
MDLTRQLCNKCDSPILHTADAEADQFVNQNSSSVFPASVADTLGHQFSPPHGFQSVPGSHLGGDHSTAAYYSGSSLS